jgi:hypothetical protein
MNSGADWNGQDGNFTSVGSAGSTCFYGAFDMNGNVREWIQDTAFNQGFRGQMGGDFTSGWNANPDFVFGLDPAFVTFSVPTIESIDVGFRFASPFPPPPCIADFNNDGSLDFFDVSGFLGAFNFQSPQADIAAPFGVLNFFDVAAYIGLFGQGCP